MDKLVKAPCSSPASTPRTQAGQWQLASRSCKRACMCSATASRNTPAAGQPLKKAQHNSHPQRRTGGPKEETERQQGSAGTSSSGREYWQVKKMPVWHDMTHLRVSRTLIVYQSNDPDPNLLQLTSPEARSFKAQMHCARAIAWCSTPGGGRRASAPACSKGQMCRWCRSC
jgi:hypothetical protein